ncbi:MAG: hypothetical protein WC082_02515 [Victivallales bacterium]
MKKLLITLFITASLGSSLLLFSGNDDIDRLSRETILSGKDAAIAEKFTHFIHDYAKNNQVSEFKERFRRIPPENVQRVWETLVAINAMDEPVKVTVPATGKTRRCVYYRKDNENYYKFVVNNTKKQWFFQNLVQVSANN